jgi:uncharacterized protein (TIGR01777 family)
MRIFITGGTGLVGQRLARALQGRGDKPVVLSRRPDHARQLFGSEVEVVQGDPTQQGPWMDTLGSCDGVVNLAGENIFARRWNDDFKKQIIESRTQATQHVAEALGRAAARSNGHRRVLVNASAIGYYGPHGDEELTEDMPPGNDFMARTCVEWEKAAVVPTARCVVVRIGVVLDRQGGALAQLVTPFKLCVGGPVAGGKQWMSWIHHEDLTGLILFALDRADVQGPLNGVAPTPVTNRDFAKALGRALHRPSFFPTPGLALRLRFGEVADVIVQGQRVVPRRPLQLGYQFRYPTIDAALAQLFAPPQPPAMAARPTAAEAE